MSVKQFVDLNSLKKWLMLFLLLISAHIGDTQYEQPQEPSPTQTLTAKKLIVPHPPSPRPPSPRASSPPAPSPQRPSSPVPSPQRPSSPAPSLQRPSPQARSLKPASTHEPTKPQSKTVKSQPQSAAPKAAVSSCLPDVLFVLDSTGSVSHVYNQQRRYILDIAQNLQIGNESSHVGLILYSSKARQEIVVELNKVPTKEQFLGIVENLPFHGGVTATGAALTLAKTALEKRSANKKTTVLVLTDGYSFDDTKGPADALHSLPSVQVLVVGDTDHILKRVLEEIGGGEANVLLGEANKSKVLAALKC